MRIAVIGAGIFGCSAALALAKKGFKVTIFERYSHILSGASTNNHLRHHYGYHYPRSAKTAQESIDSRKSFEEEYGECVIAGFPAYYAVSKENSKSTPEQFLEFCETLKLPYKIVQPDKELINPDKISICLETPEPAYDPQILGNILQKKLASSNIELKLNSEVIGGRILKNSLKELNVISDNKTISFEFDFIVSAIYSNFNKINEWFGFPKTKFRYDLMELIDVELPIKKRISAMIVDGEFSTFVALKEPGQVRLGHSKEVFLKTVVSDNLDSDSLIKDNIDSNHGRILSESAVYFPMLNKAKYLKSTFIVRIIKSGVESTDERPSDITSHGQGIYSIFGGKVITAVNIAKKLAVEILEASSNL